MNRHPGRVARVRRATANAHRVRATAHRVRATANAHRVRVAELALDARGLPAGLGLALSLLLLSLRAMGAT